MNKLTYKNNRLLKHFPLKYDNGKKIFRLLDISVHKHRHTQTHMYMHTPIQMNIYTSIHIHTIGNAQEGSGKVFAQERICERM